MSKLDLQALRAMKKSSASSLTKISTELSKQANSQGGRQEDTRFWKAAVDKAGNGSAVIRFLPAIDDDALPWAKVYDKGFQGPTGKWYIEKCLTTIGQPDPVVEHCNELWNGTEADKEIARKRKRRLSFIFNVLVIKDPANPENEGQVKLFKCGKKLFDQIQDALSPEFEDMKAINVFDPWEGANFRLRIRKVDGYSSTDKSEFDSPKPISDDDEEILKVLNSRHGLAEFTDPSTFKSYDELKRKLDMVLSGGGAAMQKANDFLLADEKPVAKEAPKAGKVKEEPKAKAIEVDDDEAIFRAMMEDDDIAF